MSKNVSSDIERIFKIFSLLAIFCQLEAGKKRKVGRTSGPLGSFILFSVCAIIERVFGFFRGKLFRIFKRKLSLLPEVMIFTGEFCYTKYSVIFL